MPDPEVLSRLVLSVGTHRAERPLSPVQVAEAVHDLVSSGLSLSEIADQLQLDNPTMLSRFRSLLRLPSSVQCLIDWQSSSTSISMSAAHHIARLRTSADREDLARSAIEHRLSSKELQQVVQVVDRSAKTLEEAIEGILRLRPQIKRVYLFVGAITLDGVKTALVAMAQQDRDKVLLDVLRKSLPAGAAFKARLGASGFTFVGGPDLAAAVKALAQPYERIINTLLAEELVR